MYALTLKRVELLGEHLCRVTMTGEMLSMHPCTSTLYGPEREPMQKNINAPHPHNMGAHIVPGNTSQTRTHTWLTSIVLACYHSTRWQRAPDLISVFAVLVLVALFRVSHPMRYASQDLETIRPFRFASLLHRK